MVGADCVADADWVVGADCVAGVDCVVERAAGAPLGVAEPPQAATRKAVTTVIMPNAQIRFLFMAIPL